MKFTLASIAGFSLTAFMAPFPFSAAADEASDWVSEDAVKSRLISSYKSIAPDRESLYIGWQVQMEDGWKTYWRTPGEAGLPPVFSWEGSENITAAEVFYPLPHRFTLFGIETFGYDKEVIMPVRLSFVDPLKPAHVKLRMTYMVCSDVCIPYEANYQLTLPPAEFADERTPYAEPIYQALSLVPSAGEDTGSGLAIETASLRGPAGNQILSLDIKANQPLTAADVMVEAGPEFAFGKPQIALRGDGAEARVAVSVFEGIATQDLAGHPVTITLTDGLGQAIERRITFD